MLYTLIVYHLSSSSKMQVLQTPFVMHCLQKEERSNLLASPTSDGARLDCVRVCWAECR